MSNGSTLSLPELEDRIAIVRDNIRQLIEQAAADSGAANEARNADRIAQQNAELERLTNGKRRAIEEIAAQCSWKRNKIPLSAPQGTICGPSRF